MKAIKFQEQRVAPRERLALKLKLSDGSCAVTRDISPTGLFFEIEGLHLLGGEVQFELQLFDARIRFSSAGEVVRVEHANGTTGVAIRLLAPRLEPIE